MPTISAALIVKDEEKFLGGCLESLVGHVDEVVVVDTGSRDSSPQIAEAAGARLFHFTWTGDFSAARNHGLDRCRGDWILYIDADERLSVDPPVRLGQLIDRSTWIGALVRFRPKTGYTRYPEPRLYRRDSRLRFSGRIHETFLPALLSLARDEGLEIGRTAARIDHLGYDGDQAHKHQRNLPLLEQSVQNTPDRVYLWYHLAETLIALGRGAEAMVAGQKGIACSRADATDKSRYDASMIYQLLSRLELDAGRDVAGLITEGLRACPERSYWIA